MSRDEFNILAEKIYPDIHDRKNAEIAIEMIVTTEQLINAEKNYNDAKKKIRKYLRRQNSNFPGSFLIPPRGAYTWLRELINFTFGE